MKKRRYSCVRLNPHSSLFLFLRLSIFVFLTSSTSSTTLQNELRRRQSHQVEEDDLSPYHHHSTPSQDHHRTPYPEDSEDPVVPTSSKRPKPSESVKIEEEEAEEELLPMERLKRAFGRNDYLLPENFKTLRRADIPVTYRLHDDLLRYYSILHLQLSLILQKRHPPGHTSEKSHISLHECIFVSNCEIGRRQEHHQSIRQF
ncbi:hypothetical protein B9Z55_026869 [Caenorhabditis nigoni]|nr:hypothetical protein B9Z55_026869 [Caenorhabditis nigoni]